MRRTEADPRAVIRGWAALATEVMPRVAPILLVVRAAAQADTSLVPLRDELDAARLSRMAAHARHLQRRGHLRAGVTATHARDILFACSAPELYELLVLRQGWTVQQFATFTADAMISALLDPA